MAKRVVFDSQRVNLRGRHCIYCGLIADSDEHFPPLSATGPYGRGVILSACRECNSLAGNSFPYDLSARAANVKIKLRKRYARFIKHIPWDEYELAEMSANFRRELKAWVVQRDEVMERLHWSFEAAMASLLRCEDIDSIAARAGLKAEDRPEWIDSLASFAQTLASPISPPAAV